MLLGVGAERDKLGTDAESVLECGINIAPLTHVELSPDPTGSSFAQTQTHRKNEGETISQPFLSVSFFFGNCLALASRRKNGSKSTKIREEGSFGS